MIYYISDLHIGHKNILKLSNRPFKNIEEMLEKIIENWNNVVKQDDDVYILGDMFYRFGGNVKNIIRNLNGHKHLIIGNHDKQLLNDKAALELFYSVDYYKEIKDTLYGKDKFVILSHYPMCEWNGFYRNSIHLYGHIHNSINTTFKIMRNIPNAYNVGADILDFTPCTLEQIIEKNKEFQERVSK